MKDIPRYIYATILLIWSAASLYPAWSIEAHWRNNNFHGTLPASRSFVWDPPLSPKMPNALKSDDARRERIAYRLANMEYEEAHWSEWVVYADNPTVDVARTFMPAISATGLLLGIGLLQSRRKPD